MLTADRQVQRLSLADFPAPVEPLDRVRIPKTFNPRTPQSRRDLASTLRNALGAAATPTAPRPPRPVGRGRRRRAGATCARRLRAHPCHGCAEREDHARWAER